METLRARKNIYLIFWEGYGLSFDRNSAPWGRNKMTDNPERIPHCGMSRRVAQDETRGLAPKFFIFEKGDTMASDFVKTATDDNFETEVLKSSKPSVVDFWAVWCGPCRALAPIIDELAEANASKVNVYKLNVDDNPNVASQYGIRGIPTLLFFKDGKMVQQQVGVVAKESLQKIIDQL